MNMMSNNKFRNHAQGSVTKYGDLGIRIHVTQEIDASKARGLKWMKFASNMNLLRG